MKTGLFRASVAVFASFLLGVAAANRAAASVLFEDVFYWMPDGSTLINPSVGPLDAYVKIQETVYDDAQGKFILGQNLGLTIHGPAIPTDPINLYVYSISNIGYGNGPFTGVGSGVSGFNIVNTFNVPLLGQWGPNGSASWWEVGPFNSGAGNIEWDIDGNNNGLDGDGTGITAGLTFDGFMYAVADGTPHGITGGHWVHTWSGSGALEQPASVQADTISGYQLSLAIPEPSTIGLVVLGITGAMMFGRRRHR